jgi:predicted phosphohydrolase
MNVWGIADLHLSGARPDRRERHAARWKDHTERIAGEWRTVVGPDDVVLIPGDISMARNHRELQPDLEWLERLPGLKVLSAGNHDVWWNGVERIRPMLRKSLRAVGGGAISVGDVIVCGTRGTPVLSDEAPAAAVAEEKREIERLDRALKGALALRTANQPVFVLWHYPPFDAHRRPGPCVALLERAGVTACVYGHAHAEGQWGGLVQGAVNGVCYHGVAADAVGFRPYRLANLTHGPVFSGTTS